jgi:hypothetical protein
MYFDFLKAIVAAEHRRNKRFVFSGAVLAYVNERIDAELHRTLTEQQMPQATGTYQIGDGNSGKSEYSGSY